MRKSSKTNKANCKICAKEFMTQRNEFCSTKCRNIDYARKEAELVTGTEGIDYIICKWCGMKAKRLYLGHIKTHHPGKTTEDYKREFPGAFLSCKKDNKNVAKGYVRFTTSEDGKKYLSEKIKGEKNPNSKTNTNKEQRKSRSPFSIRYYIKLGFSEDEAREKISQFATDLAAKRLTATQLEYWILKTDGDVELAKSLYKERQSTFTLEKCIRKLGEVEGRKRWIKRQELWCKKYRKKSYSFISQELFWKIQDHCNFDTSEIAFATFNLGKKTENDSINLEARLYLDNRMVLPDFIHFSTKKIIEFDGVYYHRNTPENKTREFQRDEDLRRNGYLVFHVNEKEYRESPEATLQKCIQFLNEDTDKKIGS